MMNLLSALRKDLGTVSNVLIETLWELETPHLIAESIPNSLRSRWPLKKYFWQDSEIQQIHAEAEKLTHLFGKSMEIK